MKAEEFQTCSLLGSGAVGRSEAEQIHTENVRKLSAMTTEQILKEREELLGVLGPEMVAFVRDRAARIVVPPGSTPFGLLFRLLGNTAAGGLYFNQYHR